jgi:hypothetical protein
MIGRVPELSIRRVGNHQATSPVEPTSFGTSHYFSRLSRSYIVTNVQSSCRATKPQIEAAHILAAAPVTFEQQEDIYF